MARSKKPGTAGTGRNDTAPPYTDQKKKTYEFASTRRPAKIGGVIEKLTNREIMERSQFQSGMAGNSVAQRDYLRRADEAEEARREHIDAQCTFWSQVKAKHQRVIDEARAAKQPIPRVLPHPDDITIDWENGVRIPGPIDEDEWKRFNETVLMRDALYVQQAMEDAVNGVSMRDRPTLGAPGLLALVLNQTLPPSFRQSESDWGVWVDRLTRHSQRDLLRQSGAAWKAAVGARVSRGKQFGTREKLEPMLYATRDMMDAYKTREDDPQGYDEAIDATARAMMEFARSAPKLTSAKADKPKKTERVA